MELSSKAKIILKRVGIVLGSILFLLFIALSVADYYISSHKEKIITAIKEKVQEATGAKVDIGDLDVSVWRSFPRLRVGLSEVRLKDSVFKEPLLQFRSIYTKVSLLEAMVGNVRLGEVRLVDGQVNLLTDTSGYSNLSIFKSQKDHRDTSTKKTETDIPVSDIYLHNVHFVLDDKKGNKYYGINVNKIKADFSRSGTTYNIGLDMDVKIEGLAFNKDKGPFLHNKTLVVDWNNMQFDSQSGDLRFDKSPVEIDGHVFNIGGGFNFSSDSATSKLDLKVDSKGTTFKDCASLLASNIQQSLDNYTCTGPVDIVASLYGSLQQSTPHILVKLVAPNNTVGVKTLDTQLDSCSFVGSYNNQNDKTKLPDDSNSTIVIAQFKSNLAGIPLVGERMNIVDLKNPYLDMSLSGACLLPSLNDQLGMETLDFLDGKARLALGYKGRIPPGLGLLQNLSGDFVIANGKAMYRPKGLLFENCNGAVSFSKNRLKVDNLRATLNNNSIFVNIDGNSIVGMESGTASVGFIHCDVNAPYLNLNYFSRLFQEAQPSSPRKSKSSKSSPKGGLASSQMQIDELLQKGEFRLNIHSKEIKYSNFAATNFESNIVFKDHEWDLKKFAVNHAGGTIRMTGVVNRLPNGNNKTKLNLDMQQVQLDKLLYAFDNFGVNGLSHKNLKGTFSTRSQLTILIDQKGNIVPHSSVGNIGFNLANGRLLNYPPLLSLQQYVFKKRNLNDVRFANISDTVLVRHGNFFINRMEIASTALRLFVEGIYSPNGNSDISIQVPFSSLLKKKDKDEALEKTDPDEKVGASIYLRATNRDGGPMSVKLDAFKKLRKDGIRERFDKEFGTGEE
ncbi:MAG: AsmA-like C-terminal region-containing protein [Chitinophagaceae bacterium]